MIREGWRGRGDGGRVLERDEGWRGKGNGEKLRRHDTSTAGTGLWYYMDKPNTVPAVEHVQYLLLFCPQLG